MIINGGINLAEYINDQEYASVTLKNGEISVDTNGKEKTIFTQKGGILNLNQETFVVFPVYFGNKNDRSGFHGITNAIMIDSVIYVSTDFVRSTDSTYLNIAEQIKKKPYKTSNVDVLELTVINPGDFFAEKAWAYDINETIPEEIEVDVQQGFEDKIKVRKKTVKTARFFSAYTTLSDDFRKVDLKEIVRKHLAKIDKSSG